jgi:hypothetical protein
MRVRDGWSLKETARVLGIHPNKVPQALTPALFKIAKLMIADPIRTSRELLYAMEQVEQELIRAKLNERSIMPRGLSTGRT